MRIFNLKIMCILGCTVAAGAYVLQTDSEPSREARDLSQLLNFPVQKKQELTRSPKLELETTALSIKEKFPKKPAESNASSRLGVENTPSNLRFNSISIRYPSEKSESPNKQRLREADHHAVETESTSNSRKTSLEASYPANSVNDAERTQQEKDDEGDAEPLDTYSFKICSLDLGLDEDGKQAPELKGDLLKRIKGMPDWDNSENYSPDDQGKTQLNAMINARIIPLGLGGTIILKVSGGAIVDGKNKDGRPEADFVIFENPFKNQKTGAKVTELADVFIAEGNKNTSCENTPNLKWINIGQAGNGLVNIDAAFPIEAGGDKFDIAGKGLSSVRFIKIVDASKNFTSPQSPKKDGAFSNATTKKTHGIKAVSAAGFDLDSVALIHTKAD